MKIKYAKAVKPYFLIGRCAILLVQTITLTGVALDPTVMAMHQRRAGRFILATNVLDVDPLSGLLALQTHKGQQGTERGFRFLKDPLFFASSVFLKSPERIMALAIVRGLCLLAYNLGQRQRRQAL